MQIKGSTHRSAEQGCRLGSCLGWATSFSGAGGTVAARSVADLGWFALERNADGYFFRAWLGVGAARAVVAFLTAGWGIRLASAAMARRAAVSLLLAAPILDILSAVIEFAIVGAMDSRKPCDFRSDSSREPEVPPFSVRLMKSISLPVVASRPAA